MSSQAEIRPAAPSPPTPVERPSFFERVQERSTRPLLVTDLMTTDVLACQRSDSCAEVAARMREGNVGMLPVLDGGQVVGIVTDRDIALRHVAPEAMGKPHPSIVGCMTSNVISVTPDSTLESAVSKMRDNRVRRLLVMEGRSLQGILTLDDVFVETGSSAEVDRVVKSALAGARGVSRK